MSDQVGTTTPNDLARMKEAHDLNDWESTQNIAHKIKGGAVYLGTVRLKMACQHLEHYWKSGHSELLEPLYQQVITVINDSLEAMNDWLEKHG
ncbi:Hpt domain-containing protein [Legionella jordanis]|uniref:Hpt domain-containing protein n=1 Tax=Legionella jordanis TaxID=456 RepID=UPI0010411850|nr:Hpt domain-containing protein [Legionella jordanis]